MTADDPRARDPHALADLQRRLRLDGPPCWFGSPGRMRRELVALVLSGTKQATASLVAEYAIDDEPLPRAGMRSAVIDDAGDVVAVLITRRAEQVRLAEVTWEFADAEAEGFTDVADWRTQHEAFWRATTVPLLRARTDPMFVLDDDTLVLCEWFVIEPVDPPVPWPGAPEPTA